VEKTKLSYVLPTLAYCYSITTSFDLWMSKGAYDIFSLVINFLGAKWQLERITIRLFEASNSFGFTLAKDLIELLDKYDLRKKITAYVKNEIFNLNTMTTTLKSIISCDTLGLP
jgi:hypothetical protein